MDFPTLTLCMQMPNYTIPDDPPYLLGRDFFFSYESAYDFFNLSTEGTIFNPGTNETLNIIYIRVAASKKSCYKINQTKVHLLKRYIEVLDGALLL